MSTESKVGLLVKSFREERKLTQEQLAQAIGKTDRTISQIEHGKVATSIDTLRALAEALDTPLWRLLKFANDEAETGEARFELLSRLFAKLTTFTDQEIAIVLDQASVIEKHSSR